MFRTLNNFFMHFEWRLSLATVIWSLLVPAGSFALPAWATKATGVFSEYAPLSWVVAGFGGLLCYALAVFIYGTGQQRSVRSRYDAKFMQETGGIDPLATVFEAKRIYLNDFVLPSNPVIMGKTFVNCEIVGPANLYLEVGNGIDNVWPDKVDAVALSGDNKFYNGFLVRDCRFRGCRFHRTTLFFEPKESLAVQHLEWLNWISPLPSQDLHPGVEEPTAIEDQSDRSPTKTEEEKQH
ncbi:hypothetical protein [Primorskyibacter sp. S187A]|uniref:hypothetical protein n=1 Tax=Primorskyibacter sp. S187A TaxID=3415130 RepID=UPI003C7DBED4